ncbi:MAG TPA: redoxin domain-containing protein [Pirellulales bacterium]|jgi:peroxiredoxin
MPRFAGVPSVSFRVSTEPEPTAGRAFRAIVPLAAIMLVGLGATMVLAQPPAENTAAPVAAGTTATAATAATSPAGPAAFLAAAAKAKQVGPLPGHSTHGEAFDDGPRQAAYQMGGTGRVHLPITSAVAGVQQLFDQGVGQLHGFWYLEAERSFRQAATLDPQCAMPYWGMAMANTNNEKRAKHFIAKAVERKAQASPRESLWIDALANYYAVADKDKEKGDDNKKDNAKKDNADNKTRRRDLVRALEQIVQDYPDELEAKAFLAVQIWENGSKGLPLNSHQAVDALLAQVFAAEPMHPAHHYRIHLWDKEKPLRAIESAARCGEAAPSIAHMWHMPGHIYSGLHRYAEAAWQQEASARVDHAHMIRDRILPDQIHNYAHNNEWLIRDWVHVGRAHDAVALAKNMIELPRHPEFNVLKKSSSSKYGRERLFDALSRYELWTELVQLADSPYLEPTDIPDEQVKRLRALGVAHVALENVVAAKEQVAALEAMLAKVKAEQQTAGEEAEKKARDEKKSDEDVTKAKNDAIAKRADDIKEIESALAEIAGRQKLATKDYEGAKVELAKVDDLDNAFQSQMALLTGDAPRAEQLAREAVERAEGEALSLANYADILWRAGKTAEAKTEFEKLRALSAPFDLDAGPFKRLSPIAQDLGLAEDWRVPVTTAADFGARPPLDSLGPLRWSPRPAEPWSLADAEGKPISLQDYAGKPVIVVFYLGFGCLHCVEQLKVIEPMTGDFAAAGISLLAISTETADQLRAGLAKRTAAEGTPKLPIIVDPAMQVFRQYRAYDDFEGAPLHATFLIDGQGLVRWQDVGPEPFMDMKFLLGESQRLLSLPQQCQGSKTILSKHEP